MNHTTDPAADEEGLPQTDGAATAAQDSLEDQIEALKGELEQLRAQSLLERADLENQRKRLARDVDNARRFANERLLGELLPLFDSMEAGLANAAQNDPLRAGLELTLKQLHTIADRKSTRLNSSHLVISYAVFCL